ncbi:hypothetical protein K2173_021805 [Erythroxylum novogranatense]|uniref:Disease resistance RPP13-like protein 1 n=1 Tax=Erythroxylum novogranatense TaxID=1862640 RepID=A0AAV8TVC3_9ROSI|nr:hypothetical protein K2173_021805 [Erythroxylum novogranatense]
MAAELVGGAFLSSLLSVLFEKIASRPVVDFFKARKLDHTLVHKLKIAMNSVGGLLDDAEEQEITRPAVKEWLDQLKHAFFEADDLLDEVSYEATRLEVAENKYPLHCMRKVHGLFSKPGSFKEMQDKLKEIIETFEFLVNQKEVFGLREGTGRKPSSQKLPTTSRVDESSVLGREADKEAILKLILSEDLNGDAIGVMSIVGMGGVGKTTLAQILYKDKRDFDVFKITRHILKEIGIMGCVNRTPNQLQIQLEERLAGKKFILFLDDVWNEKHNDWDTLITPFKAGASGSWVIVTTRNDTVASVVSSSFVLV